MLILLPPSETKRDGGDPAPLDYAALSHPAFTTTRRALVRDVSRLARDPEETMKRLKLGQKLTFEVERNRTLSKAPTMPALERYTGVLYEALGAESLSAEARAFAELHVRIHSALFGLVGAGDPIPAYRLSHDSRLDAPSVKTRWAAAVAKELARHEGELILDLRSEAYVALGPAPAGSWFLRVVSRGPDGVARALNHFNKKGKGTLVRAIAENGVDFADVDSLIAWGAGAGHRLSTSGGELVLEV
ncbi:peroxide stress protein YaaA [Herbiconiux sp. CPCC 203407]|uniref:Peroxide stress protein YaaA n=1 Tax=Herbiconiux oxytropis TaxID=2970915 RepID=A0AA41XHX5_9MICO|nr:peroxide stress protein YaaA [Herbiconiux oxytropis]MCS5721401.1 peroxide stress protein YaaA [Herbiconiux oxytropis]MCS5726160.1 peroxide stress protein YaaA [Herbiconiux oxytropis]